MKEIIRPVSLTEQATQLIHEAIISGDLVPGELYSAAEMGKKLGVSRTPIREAFLELERRGLLQIVKKRGARVVSTSIESLLEVFQVRLMLELPLARQGVLEATEESIAAVEVAYSNFADAVEQNDAGLVLHADRDFHTALLAGAGNERAKQILREQRDFVLNTGVGTVPISRTPEECFADHADIIDAFRASDADGTAQALGRHIIHTAAMLVQQETGSGGDKAREHLEWLIH